MDARQTTGALAAGRQILLSLIHANPKGCNSKKLTPVTGPSKGKMNPHPCNQCQKFHLHCQQQLPKKKQQTRLTCKECREARVLCSLSSDAKKGKKVEKKKVVEDITAGPSNGQLFEMFQRLEQHFD